MHAPPVQLGLPSLHSFIKEHSLQASPGVEKGGKADPGLDDQTENEVDISLYSKEVRIPESSGQQLSGHTFSILPSILGPFCGLGIS